MRWIFAAALAVTQAAWAGAPLQLDGLFQDHMVLPRHRALVSGRAAPGERVTVSGFHQTSTGVADAAGRFRVTLPDFAPNLTGSLSVVAGAAEPLVLNDLITGDVHLCSGQSNMQVPVTRALNWDVVIANSANPLLRMVSIPVRASPAPLAEFDVKLAWEKASPQTLANWSATCYFFGAALQRRTGIPIGLVHASLGGSNATAWLSPAGSLPDYAQQQALLKLYAQDVPRASHDFGKDFEQWWQATKGPGMPWSSKPAELQSWRPVPDAGLNWEKWGVKELAAYDGALWYATTLELTLAQAAQAGTLELGLIDEVDLTWLNGQPVGFTSGAGTVRRYAFAAGALRAGANTVVVNVVDLWSYGGMYGNVPRALLLADGSRIPLTAWRWQPVPEAQRFPPRAPWDSMAGVSVLHNGMVAAMGPFAFASTVWYQGESNVGNPYQRLLARLFQDWRSQFGEDMLFDVVQLANYGPRKGVPAESALAQLREDQRMVVAADRRAVIATAVDLGEPTDVHPAGKEVLGERLARAVAIRLYGETGSASGPMIRAATRRGSEVVLSFDGLDGDFLVYGATRPIGFELCSAKACHWAEARIVGREVLLSWLPTATRVRYCWADSPTCTLYDGKLLLPVLPFEAPIRH